MGLQVRRVNVHFTQFRFQLRRWFLLRMSRRRCLPRLTQSDKARSLSYERFFNFAYREDEASRGQVLLHVPR